jgi:Spy/CpxP family protein refolding chaperone
MKTRTITLLVVLAAITLAIVPFVYAQQHGHMHRGDMAFGGMGMFGHFAKAKEALGLSDQQVSDIKAIFTDLRTQNQPYRQQLRGGMLSVAQALINNPNDLTAAQNLLSQQEQAEHAMNVNALAAAAKALNVMTPDQRTKLSQFVADRAARMQERMK